jgi:hypothetical protein
MARSIYIPLEVAYEALVQTNGAVIPAARQLGVPPHTLKSLIKEHAELQSLTLNRDIEIEDRSRDIVLAVLNDDTLKNVDKQALAKWALENLASDVYSKKNIVETQEKPIEQLSEEELLKKKETLLERLKLIEAKDASQ